MVTGVGGIRLTLNLFKILKSDDATLVWWYSRPSTTSNIKVRENGRGRGVVQSEGMDGST